MEQMNRQARVIKQLNTVHQKWEGCGCGAGVSAEGTEKEVLEVCRDFRARHRHIEQEVDTLTVTHLRGITKTACGLSLWATGPNGPGTAVHSVGYPHIPDQPVTCEKCIETYNLHPTTGYKIERWAMGFDPRQIRTDEKGWERAMAATEVGSLTMRVFTGIPARTDKNYAVLVEGNGLCVFDGWGTFHHFDNDKPTVFEDPADAEKTRAATQLLYERMDLVRDVKVIEREVLTYITGWQYPGNGPVDLTS